jgi:hypothetical protein
MVTQGVGGTGGAAYARLTRGKETLVKLFLTLPACATSSQSVKITNASLQVSSGAAANTLFTSFASQPALPATILAASVADPVFVVPSANLIPGAAGSTFTANFTATVTYAFSDGTTAGTGTKTFPAFSKDFDAANALRVYVVPMGDGSQSFNTQYTAIDQTIVQNAMQTLSRIYPVQTGVADLTLASGGVRYIVDTATMLDLKSIPGAYVTSGGVTKFCGTSANFSSIKGLLAQYLLTHNKANRAATADRVIGVVGGNGSPSGPISFGTENNNGCADGMASVSSAEAWIRLVSDQLGQPSRSGSLAAMEVTHTFSLEQTSSYHSSKIEADLDGTVNTDRSYNSVTRSRIPNDHSVMNYNNTGSYWNNDTTLLEANDFAFLFCKLRPSSTTGCSSPGKIGSSTGVAAGEKYVIAGTTDGLPANTTVIEPYYALDVAETPESTNSLLRLLQLTSSPTPTVVANFGIPWSEPGTGDIDDVGAVTNHDAVGDPGQIPILSGARTFYAAAPGFSTAAGEVRLVKLGNLADPPLNGVTLFSSLKITAPSITSLSAVNPPPTTGGIVTVGRSQMTPRIPPKPDIVFLADTTGSMGPALENVKDNANRIMNEVLEAQPNAQFAVASYRDEPDYCSDAYTFQLEQAITSNATAVQSAINSWAASGGCDVAEAQLYALSVLGTSGAGYREGSSRVIAWFGDAPGHDPSLCHDETDAIVALRSGGPTGTGPAATGCGSPVTSQRGSKVRTVGQATSPANAGINSVQVQIQKNMSGDWVDVGGSQSATPIDGAFNEQNENYTYISDDQTFSTGEEIRTIVQTTYSGSTPDGAFGGTTFDTSNTIFWNTPPAAGSSSIRVVAVNMPNADFGSSLDQTGQATRIAKATGGVVKNTTDAAEVSQAILDGLHDLSVKVTPDVDVEDCDFASVTFSPESQTVIGGTNANFAETVTIAAGTTAGIHTCRVNFLLDGQFQNDPAFTQIISIDVGGTQQQYVKVTATSSEPDRLLLDLIFQCTDFNFVADIAVQPTKIESSTATFNTLADTTNACARFGGGGTLVPYVSDGWNRVAGTGGTAQTNTPSAPKTPTAAIYSPTIDAQLTWDGTLALRGSGQVAGTELPGSALSWSLIGPPNMPSAPGSGNAGTGNVVDKPAPMPNSWAKGTWTAVLTVTFCQTSKKSECLTATASRQFEVTNYRYTAYTFIGFLSPVVNPPKENSGTAGQSFALKWQLKIGTTILSDLATVVSTQYEPIPTGSCGAPASPASFAQTSGQSVLRFDQTNMQYVFNWQTPSVPGLYLFRLTLSDDSIHDACVKLTKK